MRPLRCWLGHKWKALAYLPNGVIPRELRCTRCDAHWAMKPWSPPPPPRGPDETEEQYRERYEKAWDAARANQPIHPEQVKAARKLLR